MATVTLRPGATRRSTALAATQAFGLLFGALTTPVLAQTSTPVQSPVFSDSVGNVAVPAQSASSLSSEELGDLQMARRQYQAALQIYKQVSPKSASVWNKIGIAQQQMFVTEEAKRSYETALKLDTKNPDVMNNLGSIYYSLKQYSFAERWYRKALKIRPKSALVYKNLGTTLLAEDKFKKGWDCYQTALAIDPEIFERISQLRIGEPTPAQKRGAMNYYLAKSYARVGMQDRAVDYLRMAIDEGFTDRKRVLADKEFAGLRGSTSFERLISEQREQ
jgi:Tfp pilus assembly protein PilF